MNYDNRTIYLNGISVEFVEQLTDNSILLRIRWDDNAVRRDVRWCGNIVLHEGIRVDKKCGVLLDRGLTPQRPVNADTVDGNIIFTDPTAMTIRNGAAIDLGKRAVLELANGSSLIMQEGSRITMERRARLIVPASCRLVLRPGAVISGKGSVILGGGSITGMDAGNVDVRVKILK
jgi:hypothetical protein